MFLGCDGSGLLNQRDEVASYLQHRLEKKLCLVFMF